MTRYIKDAKGQFKGSIGAGATEIPSASDLPSTWQSEGDFGWGEQADLEALFQGWNQHRQVKDSCDSPPELETAADEFIGIRACIKDESTESFLALTDDIFQVTDKQSIPRSEMALGAWENLQPELRAATQELSELEYELAKRLDAEGTAEFRDEASGITAHPVGGPRYSGWRHEEIQTALITALAEEESKNGVTQQQVAATVNEYASYSTPSYYRVAGLEEIGIAPKDFAQVGQDDRRLYIKGLPDEVEGMSQVLRGAQAFESRTNISEALSRVPALCQRIREMDSTDALVSYAAVANRVSTLRDSVNGLRELARRQLVMQGRENAVSTNGASYQLIPGRTTRTIDLPRVRPYVVDAISRDIQVPREIVERLVSRYEMVARITSYRAKALEKKARIEVEDFSAKVQTQPRLVSQRADD